MLDPTISYIFSKVMGYIVIFLVLMALLVAAIPRSQNIHKRLLELHASSRRLIRFGGWLLIGLDALVLLVMVVLGLEWSLLVRFAGGLIAGGLWALAVGQDAKYRMARTGGYYTNRWSDAAMLMGAAALLYCIGVLLTTDQREAESVFLIGLLTSYWIVHYRGMWRLVELTQIRPREGSHSEVEGCDP